LAETTKLTFPVVKGKVLVPSLDVQARLNARVTRARAGRIVP
jgi:hypothetical protein